MKLTRIADGGVLDFTPLPTGFTQDVADTLGNLGESNDGWDQLFTDMALSVDGDAFGLGIAVSGLLQIADTNFDAFSASWFSPIVQDLGTLQTSGDALLGQFNTDSNPPSNPPPTPAPPAPPGSGGGGGGGGGSGGPVAEPPPGF